MVIGGSNGAIRGCIGTVLCKKRDPDYVNVYIPDHGKFPCHVDTLIPLSRITMKNKTNSKLVALRRWLSRLVLNRRRRCPKQREIHRLRKVLHEIVDSRPDEHMDIEKTPELTRWICDACRKARVGAYPSENK